METGCRDVPVLKGNSVKTLVHRRTKAKPGPMAKVLQIPEQVRPFWSDEEREEEGERESARERV